MGADSLKPLFLPQKNARITWNPEALGEALTFINDYQKFSTEILPKMPTDWREIAKIGAATGLEYSVSTALAKAYSFEEMRKSASSIGKLENELRAEVQAFKLLAPNLSATLNELHNVNLHGMAETLESLVRLQTSDILAASYRILLRERLYTPSKEKSRSPQTPLASTMFNLNSEDEAMVYLAAQRDRVTDIATFLAEPLVSFSVNQGFASAYSGEPNVVQWQKILIALRSYTNKSPGNALARLEGLIMDLITLTPATLQTKLSGRANTALGGDTFFAQRWNDIRIEAIRKSSPSRTAPPPTPPKTVPNKK